MPVCPQEVMVLFNSGVVNADQQDSPKKNYALLNPMTSVDLEGFIFALELHFIGPSTLRVCCPTVRHAAYSLSDFIICQVLKESFKKTYN